ncbi:hypothetical protein HOE67_00415 [Candidatus Peregrinibacteria bacterium]|jgi:hypothetical protein|nr:hypothetical protein [Candidatus Peregrinibacteria bacterium]MBT4055555.1 hypothetical protein [Candidatus Peregrinibacteria bacterium]
MRVNLNAGQSGATPPEILGPSGRPARQLQEQKVAANPVSKATRAAITKQIDLIVERMSEDPLLNIQNIQTPNGTTLTVVQNTTVIALIIDRINEIRLITLATPADEALRIFHGEKTVALDDKNRISMKAVDIEPAFLICKQGEAGIYAVLTEVPIELDMKGFRSFKVNPDGSGRVLLPQKAINLPPGEKLRELKLRGHKNLMSITPEGAPDIDVADRVLLSILTQVAMTKQMLH